MYVIDLLKDINEKDVIDSLFSIDYLFEEIEWDNRLSKYKKQKIKEHLREKYANEFSKIQKTSNDNITFDDTKILLVTNRIEDEENYFDCGVIDLSTIDKQLEYLKITNLDDVNNFRNPLHSIVFSKRNDVLGYRISQENINRYGKVLIAREILKDLTSFNISEYEREETINGVIKDLETSIKEIDKNKEKYYSIDDLKDIFGFEKSENIDKIKEKRENLVSLSKMRTSIVKTIFDIQEVLKEEHIIDDLFNEK